MARARFYRAQYVEIAEHLGEIQTRTIRERETDHWIPRLKKDNPRFNEALFRAYVARVAARRGEAETRAAARSRTRR